MVGVAHYFRILRVCLFRWSTDQVDPAERFDHWREVRAKGLFGVTAELERERREHFHGEFALQPIGKAGLIEIRASSYRVERTAGDITDAPSDSLCIYQQLSQGGDVTQEHFGADRLARAPGEDRLRPVRAEQCRTNEGIRVLVSRRSITAGTSPRSLASQRRSRRPSSVGQGRPRWD